MEDNFKEFKPLFGPYNRILW